MFGSYFLRRLRERYRLSQYDDFTIAELFRAQGARIGNDCRIQVRSLGSEPFLISIGNHCTIASDVVMITHDGATWLFTEELPTLQKFGTVEILDNCFIGYGAVLMPDVRVGPNSVVAAGAIVTKDVPPNTIVGGCPAVPICSTDEYKRKAIAIWEAQCPPGYLTDLKPGARHSPAEIQARKSRDFALLRAHLQNLLWKN